MPKSRWGLIGVGLLLLGTLFVALAQVREARGHRGVITYIPAAAAPHAAGIKLPEEQKPAPAPYPPAPAPQSPTPAQVETAPEACPPTPPCVPDMPCGLEPEPAPVEPPPPPPRTWPELGPEISDALLHALAVEDQSSLGYRPNDLVIGKLIDNRTSFQRGLFAAARAEIDLLLNLVEPPPPAAVGVIRQSLVEGNLEKWWFPSAEKTAGEGLTALKEFSAGLAGGSIRIPASDHNLDALLQTNVDLLAAAQVDVTAAKIGYFDTDDRFYRAQGTAAAALATLDAAALSFKTALAESGAGKDLDEARDWLRQAAHMSPIIVMAGSPDSSTGNHLLVMAYYLERAEDSLRAAQAKLQ